MQGNPLAAKEDYEGGYLFNIRGLIRREVFDDVLEQALDPLHAGYKDPSCGWLGLHSKAHSKNFANATAFPTQASTT